MLKKRTLEIIPIVIIMLLVLKIFGLEGILVTTITFSCLGQLDLYKILEENLKLKPLKWVGIGIGSLMILVSYYGNLNYVIEVFTVSLIIFGSLSLANNKALKKYTMTLLGIIYIPFLLQFYTLALSESQSIKLVIWFVLVVKMTDLFAYLIGSYFGQLKLAPQISPNKTIEGAIGGVLGAIIVGVLLHQWLDYKSFEAGILRAGILALFVSIVSIFSELFESSIKRWASVKHSSNKHLASGGILDKIDSCLFVGPFVYFIFKYFISR